MISRMVLKLFLKTELGPHQHMQSGLQLTCASFLLARHMCCLLHDLQQVLKNENKSATRTSTKLMIRYA